MSSERDTKPMLAKKFHAMRRVIMGETATLDKA